MPCRIWACPERRMPRTRVQRSNEMSAPEQSDSSDWVPEFLKEMRSRLNEISIAELTDALASTGLRKGGKFSKWTEFRIGLLKDFHITADIQKLMDWGINKET